jgi:hypothetical protein
MFPANYGPGPLAPFWHVGCLRVIRWRYKAMTPQISQGLDKHIESELERLTYSAYLLTLDPGLAVSVVMTAIDGSLEEITTGPELLARTVELALEQLRRESRTEGDDESSASDAVLYGHSAAINSLTVPSLKDLSGNPILLLDSTCRIAFVLHHVLGYKLGEAAAKAQMDETEYRAQLRKAYLRLALLHSDGQVSGSRFLEEPALA